MFNRLLGTKFLHRQDARASLQQIIRCKVPAHVQVDLIRPVMVEEIKTALHSIKGDKAPGPDGFCAS